MPINSAIRSMDQLKADGKVRYAWVGITTQTVTPTLANEFDLGADHGAMIQTVLGDSPAQAAGLRAGNEEREFDGVAITLGGDLIVGIDGEEVENAEEVVRLVSTRLPGEKVDLHGHARRHARSTSRSSSASVRPQLPTEE